MVFGKDFFDLQISFAEAVRDLSGEPLESTLLDYTNLYVRLGLGRDFDLLNQTQFLPADGAGVEGVSEMIRPAQLGLRGRGRGSSGSVQSHQTSHRSAAFVDELPSSQMRFHMVNGDCV